MKSKILALLRTRQTYVSGQELCEQFGVSRTAVWKAVGQLKKEGYQIEAVQNKGYLLVENDTLDVFDQRDIESRLSGKIMGRSLFFFDETDSTNAQAKQAAEKNMPHGALFVADHQTSGRGRRGRVWDSPAGKNIYFTLLLRPQIMPNQASMLTLVMAMAVTSGIRKNLSDGTYDVAKVGIKWPNDIVIDGKKVCGILTEMSLTTEMDSIQYVVIGVGINVGLQSFDEEIATKATSLEEAWGRKFLRSKLLADIVEAFESYYDRFMQEKSLMGFVKEYNDSLLNMDRQVRVLDPKGEFDGVAKGITDTGELIVQCPDGTLHNVYAGEVSVRGIYGYV